MASWHALSSPLNLLDHRRTHRKRSHGEMYSVWGSGEEDTGLNISSTQSSSYFIKNTCMMSVS